MYYNSYLIIVIAHCFTISKHVIINKYIAYHIVLVLYTRQLSYNIFPETLKTIKFMSNFASVSRRGRGCHIWDILGSFTQIQIGHERVDHNTFACVRVCMCVCASVISAFDICTYRFLVLLVHQDYFF